MQEYRRGRGSYKESFKEKVVKEIESGEITVEAARRKYLIGGKMTISTWRKKFLNISIGSSNTEIEMKNSDKERQIEVLKAKNKLLEKVLTEKETELLLYKTILEVSEDMKDPTRKKKIEEELLRRLSKKTEGQDQQQEDIR